MLIRNIKNPHKMKTSYLQYEQDHENKILMQVIDLTKQNQFLKLEVDGLKDQLERVFIAKNRYKRKYNELKQKLASYQTNSQSICKVLKRQNSGKIYTQRRSSDFSTNTHQTSQHISGPSSKINLNKISSQAQYLVIKDKIAVQEEDPYQYHSKKQKSKIEQSFQKINIGIQGITKILSAIESTAAKKQNEAANFYMKLEMFEKIFIDLKDSIIKLAEKPNQRVYQPEENRCYGCKSKSQPMKSFKNKEAEDEQLLLSGITPPQKDIQNFNDANLDNTQENYDLKNYKKKNLMQENNGANYHINIRNQKQKGSKLRESKHSFYNSKRGRVNSKSRKDSSSSSTRQRWELVNEIGKQLKNWKFTCEDSQLLEKSLQDTNKMSTNQSKHIKL